METTFNNNPNYRVAYTTTDGKHSFYEPANDTTYHQSRYVAAGAINYFANAGITKELLVRVLDEMEKAVNANKLSDVAVWINNLRYRTKYPVDEDAAIRLGLVFYFIQGEDPNKVEPHWTEYKLKLVKEDPAAYSFFMNIGMQSSPLYRELEQAISPTSLQKRREDLEGLIPHQ